MTQAAAIADYGELIEPNTLRIERRLPGPIERVWEYLTDGDKRRQWLAAGDMNLRQGAPFELVWRNDELTDPPGNKPDGFGDEHRMESVITELDPLRRLSFSWGTTGAHLDIRGARLAGSRPEPFWDHWAELKADYEQRIPA
jgi:uncharacterized protein YndB with AHSA1/START domain